MSADGTFQTFSDVRFTVANGGTTDMLGTGQNNVNAGEFN